MTTLAEMRQRELDAEWNRPYFGTDSAPRRFPWPGREREPTQAVVREAKDEDRAKWPAWLRDVDAQCTSLGLARVKVMEVRDGTNG